MDKTPKEIPISFPWVKCLKCYFNASIGLYQFEKERRKLADNECPLCGKDSIVMVNQNPLEPDQ